MSLDIGAYFAQGQALVEQALTTGGTHVKGQRGEDVTSVDPDTLETIVTAAPVTVADTVALLVPQAGGGNGAQPYPGTVRSDTHFKLMLPVAIEDVLIGDVYTVLQCRDARMVARKFKVTAIPDSSAGALRDLTVVAHPDTGQV